ncbi:MAG: hypothetical protein ACLPOA_06775 [Methylocella sp.]
MKDDRTVVELEIESPTYPYTGEEFAAIAASLPSLPRGVIAAAEEYVMCRKAGVLDKNVPKTNARAEIAMLAKWVSQGLELTLGQEARRHLADNKQTRRFPTDIDALVRDLYAFESAYRKALKRRPGGPGRGPKTRLAEERLVYRFWMAWSMAEWKTPNGKPPTRGWPKFRDLCVIPLRKFGLPKIENRGWEERLSNAKKRWNKTPG